ncbi:MAG: hypothetical protein KGL91_02355 [Xanthomonadaceae bacterium]|nr:hypothetical protein [Xanthomonadaceae bacterium]
MTTANDVIAALNQRRLLKTGRTDIATGLPVGWQDWLDTLQQQAAPIRHAPPQAWVDTLVLRPQQAVGKRGGLGAPFFQLLRLGRPANPREDRGLRIGVGAIDILLHLVLAALLLWLMYLRFLALAQQQEDEASEAVQVEFIGRGNVATGGGALANAGAESAPAAASAARQPATKPGQPASGNADSRADVALEQVSVSPPPALTAEQAAPTLQQPKPVPAEATAAQQLQVSNVPQPQPDSFQLPPPRERTVVMPEVKLRDAQPQQQVEAVATLEAQPVHTLQVKPRDVPLRAPELKTQVQALEVFTPNAQALTQQRAVASKNTTRDVQVPQLQGQVRELPMRAGDGGAVAAHPGQGSAASGQAATAGAGGNKTNAAGNGQAQAGQGAGVHAAQAGGRGMGAVGAGAGPGLKPAPGGWPGAGKSDDWGASTRNAAGTGAGHGNGNGHNGDGKDGLFNADGSARLPDQWSKNSGIDLDRSGTWLKRPGLEYRGTRFDKYWIPEGNLLQEWVRKGIKEMSIPIPGTKLKLKCVVSLLQFGGGCLPVDPDANEQNSTGRKAPEIPFKPALQEDNGSVRPAPASTTEPAPPAG